MGKPKRSSDGFSAAKPATAPKQQDAKSSADQAAKEQQAVALINQGKLQEAEAIYRNLIAAGTRNHAVYGNLGAILQMMGKYKESIPELKIALKLKPTFGDAHYNLGTALHEEGELAEAAHHLKKTIELDGDNEKAHNNLGNVLTGMGEMAAALDALIKALKLKPSYPQAFLNLSITQFHSNNYRNGWRNYESRFAVKGTKKIIGWRPCLPPWNGTKTETDEKIILASEQGLGDTLQFMRYAIALKDKGLQVSLCTSPKLHTLIQSSGIDPSPITPEQTRSITEGSWIPLLSVPRHLEVSPENPIITEPYIKTTDALTTKWQGILANEKRHIIGVNWQGNPDQEKTNSKGRSLPLETFAPITQHTNASLLSLQKGFGSEQLETCSFKDRFVSCQDQINETWDFLETAAIIANCDLVITSDTSVAHLAGGMGKTTWLLLHKVPDWRWGLEGDTTFWYPSMRLFRQKERGNWDEVLERVAEALVEEFPGVSVGNCANVKSKQAEAPSTSPKSLAEIQAPISLGELIDKITILQIKTNHLQGNALENVQKELTALQETLDALDLQVDQTLIQRLKEVNADLWQIEDAIRDQEREKDFGEGFIQLARSVYQQNDRRAAIKKEINTTYGSALVEEKSYQDY